MCDGSVELQRLALPWKVFTGRRLLCYHVWFEAISIPRCLHLRSYEGNFNRISDGYILVSMWFPIGTQTEDFIRYTFILQIIVILTWLLFLLLFSISLQSSSLPHNGTLMAVYEKTGYSHSETSLSAIIYQSAKVGIPSTGSIQDFITRLAK